jgi:DNA-binding MarR family transcriptional regulator
MLGDEDYKALAEWRFALRRFLKASERITEKARVSATQYQLLLFVRGASGQAPPISELAERLQIRHQSAVGLVDRCEAAGLVRRERDPSNRRRVLIRATNRGSVLLRRLAGEHFDTIERLGRAFVPPAPGGIPISGGSSKAARRPGAGKRSRRVPR